MTPYAPAPKRILMTADTVGGVWTYALELSLALAASGVEVALATMGATLSKSQIQEAARVPNVQLFESRFKLEWMQDPWVDVAAAGDWLLELEERIQPEIVHLNSYAHGALEWTAPVLVTGHSCVLSWWRAVRREDAPPEWDAYRDAVREGLHAADIVVAPSHAMLAALHEHYGNFAASMVIPNGRALPTNRQTRKEPFILAAGRVWDEAKNIGLLAQVAPGLPWPVCVAGDEMDPNGHIAHFNCVRHLGRLSSAELAEWFERASIFALPARYEPFGLSALEAAQAGCALVLGDIASLREIWGDAALFVCPDDPRELERTLLELISDPGKTAALATKARNAAAKFTPNAMAEHYLSAYARAMNATAAAPTREELAVCES
jgi:glycogen synthase